MRSEKVIRHTISPKLIEDRVSFQIILPPDAVEVTGIDWVCEPGETIHGELDILGITARVAGHLSLQWNLPGNIFFQTPIDGPFAAYSDVPNILNPIRGFWSKQDFSLHGKQHFPVPVSIPSHHTLRGFYKDVINKVGNVEEIYKVHLYLIYSTTKRV